MISCACTWGKRCKVWDTAKTWVTVNTLYTAAKFEPDTNSMFLWKEQCLKLMFEPTFWEKNKHNYP